MRRQSRKRFKDIKEYCLWLLFCYIIWPQCQERLRRLVEGGVYSRAVFNDISACPCGIYSWEVFIHIITVLMVSSLQRKQISCELFLQSNYLVFYG